LIRRSFGPGLQTTMPSGGTPASPLPAPYQPATRPSLRGSVPPISTPRFQSIWIA